MSTIAYLIHRGAILSIKRLPYTRSNTAVTAMIIPSRFNSSKGAPISPSGQYIPEPPTPGSDKISSSVSYYLTFICLY